MKGYGVHCMLTSHHLNAVEAAVLAAMSEMCSAPDALREQIAAAAVVSRRNTGAGFFTELKIDKFTQPVPEKIICNIFANIEGCKNPVAFVLFLKDGHIDILEGASVEDSTVDLDFSSANFNLI